MSSQPPSMAMKTSHALSKRMQTLITSIHPPNPPTSLESQQILGVLQKSFRKKLDSQHPHPANLRSKNSILYDSPSYSESSSSQATSDHFGSLLSHPILNPSIDTQNATSTFDRLMAESRLNVPIWLSIMAQHAKNPKIYSNLSGRLDTWIRMTDKESRETFFTSKPALMAAAETVNRENQEDILWKWLELVYGRDIGSEGLTSRLWLGVEDFLVSKIMNFAIQRHNISEATEQFIQACRYRESSGRGNPSLPSTNSGLPYAPMMKSAKRLASAIVFHRNQHDISLDSFDQMSKYLPAWERDPTSNHAFCMLYRPTQPSADLLYKFLCQPFAVVFLTKTQKYARDATRRAIMTAILDASKLSLAAGKRSQASFLLDFAIDNYPEYLPPRELDAVEPQLATSCGFAFV